MIDREKVISEFEDFVKSFSKRDDTYYKGLFVSVLALLKEQEAVEPIPYHRSDGTIFKYECRQCRTKIFKMDLFCRQCGRSVKWE